MFFLLTLTVTVNNTLLSGIKRNKLWITSKGAAGVGLEVTPEIGRKLLIIHVMEYPSKYGLSGNPKKDHNFFWKISFWSILFIHYKNNNIFGPINWSEFKKIPVG